MSDKTFNFSLIWLGIVYLITSALVLTVCGGFYWASLLGDLIFAPAYFVFFTCLQYGTG